jgi:alpha-D-ribose 1-methylphosphonate 5-phosphate C-P lyase
VITDDRGSRMFVCSDTDYCEGRRASQPSPQPAVDPEAHRG